MKFSRNHIIFVFVLLLIVVSVTVLGIRIFVMKDYELFINEDVIEPLRIKL